MTGHKIGLFGEIRKIIIKLSLLPFLSGSLIDLDIYGYTLSAVYFIRMHKETIKLLSKTRKC